ncbi:NADH-quinone oxidoreductase subunit NuoE [Knoellia sp. DB2414S]|uniref:NADH-quinone oxidoreductase subunit NuoE n=2 Tax=Knoellia koreensis TaxID=2730921 RepID=A0A849HHW9_9MICO|nr:NADH-quinone oxidoreductase subunit NuoE [Knoellia sp. DB2414S]
MAGDNFGMQTAAGHLTVAAESKEPYTAEQLAGLDADAAQVIARYPQKRSALLPLLHLVQSVDGYVTGRGIDWCADKLDLSTAEVSGVATFYTQYKRHPNGEYTVGVCTNTLCAIMGGDQIFDEVSEHLGIGHDETTPDGKVTLERIECNAACDYAPVVMANWEFFDNQTPESTKALVDDLRAGKDVKPSRGPNKVCTFKQVSRVLAGFNDGLADEGVGAGPASLAGLEVAHEHGWTAPKAPKADSTKADDESADNKSSDNKSADAKTDAKADAKTEAKATGDAKAPGRHTSGNAAANDPDEKPTAQGTLFDDGAEGKGKEGKA